MMIPDLPELPEVLDQSTTALRMRGRLTAPLPQMDRVDLGQYYFIDPRIEERRRYQEAVRIAFEITRRQNRIANARASYIDRLMQYRAERKRGWWR
jgi:hypothetical protein